MKVKEETEKVGLKTQHSENKDHGIWFHHFRQIDGKAMEIVTDFIFLGSRITADFTAMKLKASCSLEEKLWQT